MENIMHSSAYKWIEDSYNTWVEDKKDLNILEIGSLDINGSVRPIFAERNSMYLGIDPQIGPGVDFVTDASTFSTGPLFNVIVCAEVFEHTPVWRDIVDRSYENLLEGGIFIATMAGEGRAPHSAIDENPIRPWEHYENINRKELIKALTNFSKCKVSVSGTDTRCWAIK